MAILKRALARKVIGSAIITLSIITVLLVAGAVSAEVTWNNLEQTNPQQVGYQGGDHGESPPSQPPPPGDSEPPPGGTGNLPPVFSGIGATNTTDTSSDIVWNSNVPGDSQVRYHASPDMLSPLDSRLVTEHLVHLTDLTPATTYCYQVMSRSAAGILAESGEYSFTTLEATEPPPSTEAEPFNWWIILGIILGVVVILLLAYFFGLRQRA